MIRELLTRLRERFRPTAEPERSEALPLSPAPAPLDPRQVPSGVLAYIGDAVYELYVRTHLMQRGKRMPELHRAATRLVNAVTQARTYRALEPELTEVERAVARRGRNSGGGQVPRSASVSEYRHATGLECLFGHLLLSGEEERLLALLERCVKLAEEGTEG
jgi:ribonuclease-3 family protein